MIIQPLTSCLDCKRKNGCICDCLKCSEELEETQQNYSRYGASVRTKGRFSHTFFFFFQRGLLGYITLFKKSTMQQEGMQTVTMAKFTGPFNKNWMGQAA